MSRSSTPAHGVAFGTAVRVWAYVGLNTFGGPAGQIAVMHRILVEEKRWISENRFLHALNFCTFLPGPEAQQLATYVGWLMHGTRGGLIAGGLFVLPGIAAIMATKPGSTNRLPATAPPGTPCISQPTYVASCCASGPGSRVQKLRAKRKRC